MRDRICSGLFFWSGKRTVFSNQLSVQQNLSEKNGIGEGLMNIRRENGGLSFLIKFYNANQKTRIKRRELKIKKVFKTRSKILYKDGKK